LLDFTSTRDLQRMTRSLEEKFCLRWNDFENNISSAFKELKEEHDFFDVTLACEDNQLQAHKVILSACSPFFRSVLKKNPHQHPLLYLKGVKYEELQSVLNFMYHGEVNIAQEDLNSFLSVAEDLKVKGLTQKNEKPKSHHLQLQTEGNQRRYSEQSNSINIEAASTQKHFKHPKFNRNIELETAASPRKQPQQTVPFIKTEAPVVLDVEEEPEDTHEIVETGEYPIAEQDAYNYDQSYQDQDLMYQMEGTEMEQMGDSRQGWSSSKQYSCDECGKSYSSKNALTNHKNRHKGLTFCDICNRNFSTVSNLRAHMNSLHYEANL